MTYEIMRFIHVFGAIIFLGNIIITALWKISADRTNNPQIIAFAQFLVTKTDWLFTFGGVVLLVIGGYGMAGIKGIDLSGETWLVWGQGLFVVSAIIWIALLIPLQIAQHKSAQKFKDGSDIPQAYWKRNRLWYIFGIIATIIPLITLYLMIIKP